MNDPKANDLTLEEWRLVQKLTYEQLAVRLGVPNATQARRYALGLAEAGPELKEKAREISAGVVTPEGFHRARLASLASGRSSVRSELEGAQP